MFGRSGYGLTAILVAMLAAAMLVVPLTRWFLGMSAGTEDLQTKLMVQTIAKDKWDEIHAETFDDLAAALAANPSPWTEYIGDGNRWKIETTIGEEGKYVNAACADGAAGATDRKCRKVSIQVTDTMTGMTQAVNLAKVDSEYFNSRMKALEKKFDDYYTKEQTDTHFVQNRSNGGTIISAKIDETTGLIVGAKDETEALFKGPVPVPDYSRTYSVAGESSESLDKLNPLNPSYDYLEYRIGNYASQYSINFFTDHTGIGTSYNPQSFFVPPEDGFLLLQASLYEASGIPSSCSYQGIAVTVNGSTVFSPLMPRPVSRITLSDVVPVRKGDMIRYGRHYRDYFCLPSTYSIRFTPLAP